MTNLNTLSPSTVISENKSDEALRLEELYLDLKSSGRVSQPVSLMIFFYTLKQSMGNKKGDRLSLLKSKFLLPNSVPYPGIFKENLQPSPQQPSSMNVNLARKHDSQNQLIRSYIDSFSAFTNQYVNPNLNVAHPMHMNANQHMNQPMNQHMNQPMNQTNGYQFHLNQMSHHHFPPANLLTEKNMNAEEPVMRKQSGSMAGRQPRPYTIHVDHCKEDSVYVTNAELFREILLAFQGYNGRILEQSPANDHKYRINAKYRVDPTIKNLVLRLSNIGWMFFKINKYCEHVAKNESVGHVNKSFAFALQDELNSYLKLVTIIEQQLHFSITSNQRGDPRGDSSVSHSFLRLQMVTYDSLNSLRSLASLIDQCKSKRGGELINAVYKHIQQGDPMIRNMMTKLLTAILIPLRKFLSNWLFYGELDDPYKEFFITYSRNGAVSSPQFWHERYCINEHQLPAFITVEQAAKVLATGKAVNVLKQISDSSRLSIGYFEKMKSAFEKSSIEELFNESLSYNRSYFQKQLHLAYKETNRNALRILYEDYNFAQHLEGLKLFLLLGQGDFISYLMDLLEPILNKPVKQLKNHKLNNLLMYAIRSTNAQYLIDDVIERLDIRFQEKAIEETGWDIFSLVYKTTGPISIVFTNQCMENYSILSKYLWRSKRMEFILTKLLDRRLYYNRIVRRMPELRSVFHLSNILLTEMVYFIKQMQYYLKFEVIECSWVAMQKKIAEAEDIDQLIKAQEEFLAKVINRTMLDTQSKGLSAQLRAIYDTILDFQNIQNDLFGCIECELERRDQFQAKSDPNNKAAYLEEYNKQSEFRTITLSSIKVKVQSLAKTYESMVQKFLILLAEHQESDFRCLSFRIDFNEHYTKRNKSLECSFTYRMIRD